MTQSRAIIQIDEHLCNGCGQCVRDCAEGAIAIIDGKARIISESYCDGLGACLSGCPQGALSIIHRDAAPFDEQAVEAHLEGQKLSAPGGCPGTAVRQFQHQYDAHRDYFETHNWPLKLRLVPPSARFLKSAHLLLAADCAGPASVHFHEIAKGKVILLACPKFEDNPMIRERLIDLRRLSSPASVTVLRMEVPCCKGLATICRDVFGPDMNEIILGCNGELRV